MSSTVNIKDYRKILDVLIGIRKTIRIVPFVWGQHGIGKTEITRQICNDLKFNYVVLNLANQSTEDLLGYPNGLGSFIKPSWLNKHNDLPNLYFLDEMNRAPKYVLQSIFNFINEGRIHEHKIDSDDFIIAAGNPSDSNYEVTDFSDKAFLSRFCHFYLEPEQDEFLTYLKNNNRHMSVINTVETNPHFDNYDNKIKDEYKLHIGPDNRALDRIGIIMNIVEKDTIKDIGKQLFTSMVGNDYAEILMSQYKKTRDIANIDDLINSDSNKPFPFKDSDYDLINIYNSKLSKYISENLVNKTSGKVNITEKQKNNILRYLNYIPKDSQIALCNMIKKHIGIHIVEFFEKIEPTYLSKLLNK